jgi:hypothetical protein
VATEAVITGEVGAASPPASRRVPSSAVPLPARPIRPRHTRTRTRLVHTQITRIADFERLQHDGIFESRLLSRCTPSKRSRESGWLAGPSVILLDARQLDDARLSVGLSGASF